MMISCLLFLLPLFISMIIMTLVSFLSKKSSLDREKNSPFECGFDPKSSARLPFSLQFFLIAIIFLIFDVEIALLLPCILILNSSNFFLWMSTILFFFIILLLGLYHEWHNKALQWSY